MNAPSDAPILVSVSEDKMSVLLSCVIPMEGVASLRDPIREKIREKKFCAEVGQVDFGALLEEAAGEDRDIKDLLLYSGEPVVPAKDGSVEWGGEYFKEGFIVDEETGAIDFRRIAAELNAREGDLLATIIPPVEGKPGRDVFGKTVRPRKGKPAILRGSQGVKQSEPGKYYAKTSGRIRWNGKMLSIDNVYVVSGDIGLKTGHVDHPGALVVRGDILEGSEVSADGDIEVHGIVEAATVHAGGDIFVHGGIVGGEGTEIRAGGAINARYILEADIEALGDVTVEKEIVHSTVVARGDVHMPFGRILGGEIRALREIVTGCTGTDAGVRTTLILGEDPLKKKSIKAAKAELATLRSDEGKIVESVAPYKKIDELHPAKQEIVHALRRRLKTVQEDIEELDAKIQALEADRIPPEDLKVTINQQIFPDSSFHLRNLVYTIPREVQGPIKVVFRNRKIKLIAIK